MRILSIFYVYFIENPINYRIIITIGCASCIPPEKPCACHSDEHLSKENQFKNHETFTQIRIVTDLYQVYTF